MSTDCLIHYDRQHSVISWCGTLVTWLPLGGEDKQLSLIYTNRADLRSRILCDNDTYTHIVHNTNLKSQTPAVLDNTWDISYVHVHVDGTCNMQCVQTVHSYHMTTHSTCAHVLILVCDVHVC